MVLTSEGCDANVLGGVKLKQRINKVSFWRQASSFRNAPVAWHVTHAVSGRVVFVLPPFELDLVEIKCACARVVRYRLLEQI